MSIGQCIDFATHVGYRIYRSEHADPNDRIRDALGAIAWPVLQAGSSTLLAIVVMILVPSNAVRMFARTSVLVVATGLFHEHLQATPELTFLIIVTTDQA
ncbi:hypothetical protein TELCIR_20096 [Teladorsagia circumcincta]|uniref:Uncharacterized protein n=1 Tax=Teladorsagia circumcincta TaxID=45464 RepID=A0A2G9TKS1_TELCI|nr:hypothetical protein TELCIR_20096 [Teladorsagia circumcincta]